MATFTQRLSGSANDGYKSGSNWFNSTLNIPLYGTFSAFRFTSVTVLHGATINSASIQLTGYNSDSTAINLVIKGIAEDNTADFSTDPTSRSTTTATDNWNSVTTSPGTTITSPDIANIIQEITDRAGWSSGNALGIRIDYSSAGGLEQVESYDDDPTKSAFLTIDYTVVTTTSTTTTSTSTTTTSTTTTSTSSTTTSTSTTTMPDYYGIKVFKQGVDTGSLSPQNFFMNSHYSMLKIHKQGSFKGTFIGLGALLGGSFLAPVTIRYDDLNYRPFILIYCQRMKHDGSLDTDFHLLDWSYFGATQAGEHWVKIYNNHLVIDYYDQDASLDNVGSTSVFGYYYIFQEEVRE